MGPTDAGRTEPTVTGYTNVDVPRYDGVFGGTSSAAPYVAGVAALIEGASPEDQTPADLSKSLTSTADDIGYEGFDTVSGAGVINATKAVQEGVNLPPGADAGPDQKVTSQETVVLDGTNSSDPDSETFNFNWKQTTGPPVSLSSSGTLKPNFEAPNVTQATIIQFKLTVTDSSGNSDSDKVNISVQPSGVIIGDVVDTEANPIPGAQVRITNASDLVIAETTTDSSGIYTVEVPPGEYTVIVESNGSTTERTVLVEPGATINADVVIQTAASESVSPSVSISNAPDRIGPNETFVIDYEIENTGTVTGPFVLDIPASTPGVTVQDIDGDIQGSDTSAEPVTAATNRVGPNETVAVSVTYDASDLSTEDITLELTARQPLDSTSDSVSSTITVTESTDPTERALQRFDGDGDGTIDRDEAVGAIVAYNIGTTIGGEEVTRTQVVRAIVAYNTGEPIEA